MNNLASLFQNVKNILQDKGKKKIEEIKTEINPPSHEKPTIDFQEIAGLRYASPAMTFNFQQCQVQFSPHLRQAARPLPF